MGAAPPPTLFARRCYLARRSVQKACHVARRSRPYRSKMRRSTTPLSIATGVALPEVRLRGLLLDAQHDARHLQDITWGMFPHLEVHVAQPSASLLAIPLELFSRQHRVKLAQALDATA